MRSIAPPPVNGYTSMVTCPRTLMAFGPLARTDRLDSLVAPSNLVIASAWTRAAIMAVAFVGTASAQVGTNYCTPAPNSTGSAATISGSGSTYVTWNNLVLASAGLPPNAAAFFLCSQAQGFVQNPGGSAGNLCLGNPIGRLVGGVIANSGATGTVNVTANLLAMPQPTGAVMVQPGETWNFQCWYRDSVGGATTSNFSNGLAVLFEADPNALVVLSPPHGSTVGTSTITVRIEGNNWDELWVRSHLFSSPFAVPGATQIDAKPFAGDSFAIGVPLEPGTNDLLVRGRRAGGALQTKVVRVTRQVPGVAGVRVTATPTTLYTLPAQVELSLTFDGLGPAIEGWIDADGDGQLDAPIGVSGPQNWSYTSQGYFAPRCVVRFSTGLYHDSTESTAQVTVAGPPSVVDDLGGFEFGLDARDIAVDRVNREVLVLTADSRVHVFDEMGVLVGAHTLMHAQDLVAIDVDADGDLYAVDRARHDLQKYARAATYQPDPGFGTAGVVGAQGTQPSQFNEPLDVQCLITVNGLQIWVADAGNARLQRFSDTGQLQGELATLADIARPVTVVGDVLGHVTVVDGVDGDIAVFDGTGALLAYRPAEAGVGAGTLARGSVDVELGVLVADPVRRAVLRCDRDGAPRSSFDVTPAVPLALAHALDSRLLVAVAGATRLQRVAIPEPAGASPVEVLTAYFDAIHQLNDALAFSLVAPEVRATLTTVLAHAQGGPAYRALAGRVGTFQERSRSDRLAFVGGLVDAGTPQVQPVQLELRRDGLTGRWLLLGL